MAEPQHCTLSKRIIDRLSVDDTHGGEPCGGHPGTYVQIGRCVGMACFGQEPRVGRAPGGGGGAQAHSGASVRSQRQAHGGEPWGWTSWYICSCRLVWRFKIEKHHERFLTPEELYRLGQALEAAPAERLASAHVAAAIRLLVLTGCRRNEILGLRWDDVDFEAGEMRLADSKTGGRVVPLLLPAAKVLLGLSRVEGKPWVFPGKKKGTRQRNIHEPWKRISKRAGLDGVWLHDLRHSYASRALALGESLSMIGELLGHRKVKTTARYAHLARDSVRASTAKVAESIGSDILPAQAIGRWFVGGIAFSTTSPLCESLPCDMGTKRCSRRRIVQI